MSQRSCQDQPDENRLDSLIHSLEKLAGNSGPGAIGGANTSSSIDHDPPGLKSKKTARGKEAVKKRTNALFHMIRVLDRNGLCMESFCNHVDSSGTGTIRKAHFAKILKNIGFPFSWIDLNEVLLRYSNAPKFDIIDYQTFLNDAGVTSKSEKLQLDLNLDVKSTQQTGWRTYTRVLLDVKRMLLDSMLNSGKQKDDIYGMFAVWDKTNTGAVTATQFLRVLVQLQVDLRDHDQDFLVDLLDTTSMGRIDYDNLLDFCFSGFDHSVSNMEDREASSDGEEYLPLCLVENTNLFARSNQSSKDSAPVSIIYRDDVMETRSPKAFNEADVSENQNMSNRPITAYARIQSSPKNSCKFNYDEKEGSNRNVAGATQSGVAKSMSSIKKKLRTASEYGINHHTERVIDVDDQADYSAGVDTGYLSSKESKACDEFLLTACEKGPFDGDIESMHTADFNSRRNTNSTLAELDDCNLRIAVPRGEYSPNSSLGNMSNPPPTESSYGDVVGKSKRGRFERGTGEYESDINDYESWSRRRRDGHEGSHEDFKFLNSVQVLPTFHSELPCLTLPDLGDAPYFSTSDFSARRDSPACSARSAREPMEHLNNLARQTLASVRDMVLRRHKVEGKSLSIVFRHFDRTSKGYFDAKDFMTATSDLRIETSEIVATLAVAQIARDGRDTVTYGEFHVYILDPLHDALEREIVVNMAEQLEKQGRGFHTTLKTLFWDEEKIMRGGLPNAKQKGGFVSTKVFIAVLKKFGLKLSHRDLERVVARFDINNEEHSCSATRFVKMVERSEQWIAVEENITNQEVALKEASILRAELTAQKSGLLPDQTGSFGGRQLSEEMIAMAESLGIKVISEQYLLWIVRHALNVPLPTPWALVKHTSGRACYYNRHTKRSRWDHPLEHHFKELRDKHRRDREVIEGTGEKSATRPDRDEAKSVSQPFSQSFSDPQRPLLSGYSVVPKSSNQQLFLADKYDKDKKVLGLNSNDRGTWHLPTQQGNPFNPYNSFHMPPDHSRDESGREMKLPGLPITLRNRVNISSSPVSFTNAEASNPNLFSLHTSLLPVSLPDTLTRDQGAAMTLGNETDLFSTLPIPKSLVGPSSVNLKKEVKKKSVAHTGIQNQNKAVRNMNSGGGTAAGKTTTGLGKQSSSLVDRLMIINNSRK